MTRQRLSPWLVRVQEHTVAGRWHIDAKVLEVYAVNATAARVEAVRLLAARAGVAPWKPWRRYTYLRTTAELADDARTAGARA